MHDWELDASHMARALELAARGEGRAEPNPMVGCTIVQGGETVGEGYHRQFGGPHAEIEALNVAGPRARGATAFVTLEPCCHHGKTPPCTDALLAAGIRKVVVAGLDPYSEAAGRGIEQLRAAGAEVEIGLLAEEAAHLNAPYRKLITGGVPWVIAKWAMTLDGKLATSGGDSRWISSEASREIVHRIRGRVDAVLVGRGTADKDDPLLTARPAGARQAARIVLDTNASLSTDSQLARTTSEGPVLVACGRQAPAVRRDALAALGCEVVVCQGDSHGERLRWLLAELGRRRMTNLLVEGGGQVLGSLFDAGMIDEVHVFIAPKLVGGAGASVPLTGQGLALIEHAQHLVGASSEVSGSDLYVHGRLAPR